MIDALKREYDDDLTTYMFSFIKGKYGITGSLLNPCSGGLAFVEGVTGLVLHRDRQFQVQLFTVAPFTTIPVHVHPNVDSYEYYLSGMQFSYKNKYLIQEQMAHPGLIIRVKEGEKHGASSGKNGGSFLSFQHWLNGVKPTSVGNDWEEGDTMGVNHSRQIKEMNYVSP